MKHRNPAMDIIRSFALFSVISVHFFLKTGYYNEIVSGFDMYIMTTVRSFFSVCVPLFMLLSGYLLRTKQPNLSYYLKLIPTLVIYILASLCCMFYLNIKQGNPFSIFVAVIGTTSFSNAPYSWYVEMYIGLFLMIPFLNVMYNGLTTKREKQLLILSFLFVTSAPCITNIFHFGDPQWWLTPSISDSYKQLLPSWWLGIYPVTYYLLGCYFNEYPVSMKPSKYALMILLIALSLGTFQYYRSYGSPYISGIWRESYSPFVVMLSCTVFRYFQSIDYSRLPVSISKLFSRISTLSFGAYLISWIFDESFYPILVNSVPSVAERFYWFPVIVPAVFVCSIALSAVLNGIYSIIFTPILRFLTGKLQPELNVLK